MKLEGLLIATFGIVVFIVGADSLAHYYFDGNMFGWFGTTTPMALSTAIVSCILGTFMFRVGIWMMGKKNG